MTHEPINTYRRRIAVAALHRIKRKTGGNLLIVDLPDGNITTIEITEQFINQLLLRFEGITRGELGRVEVKPKSTLHTRMLSGLINILNT